MHIDLDALEAAARAATPGPWQEFAESGDWWMAGVDNEGGPLDTVIPDTGPSTGIAQETIDYIAALNPAAVLALIARLRAAEAALRAIHEFANDDGNWEHEEIIADDGMFIGCDGRYTIDVMASDALKGLADAVPNV